jgi:nitrate reductase cytochrome c-type subunit
MMMPISPYCMQDLKMLSYVSPDKYVLLQCNIQNEKSSFRSKNKLKMTSTPPLPQEVKLISPSNTS